MAGSWNISALLILFLTPALAVEPPSLKPDEFSRDTELGSRVQLVCYLKKGNLPVVFTWKKDGKHLSTNERVTISSLDVFTSNLRIQRVIPEDVANYTCTATNSAGSDSFTAALIVRAPPFWKQQPENTVQAILGTRTLIGCSVGGYPVPRVTWKIKHPSGSLTPVSKSYKMKVLDNGTLLINDLKETDSGTYLCLAENGVGENLEKAVRLSVHVPPFIERHNEVVTAQRGYTKSVRCIVRGERPLLVRWLKNNRMLEPWSNSHETYSKETSGGSNFTLVIRNIQTVDAALYTCSVENSYGNDSWNIKMIVNEPPQSPSNIVVGDVRSRVAKVSWKSSPTLSAVTQFIVRFWESSRYFGVNKLKEQVLSFGETNLLLRDLHPGTEYTVEIQAENSIGLSEPSDSVTFTTQEEEPGASPVDVTVLALDSGTLLVSWKSPPRHQWNGVLKGYYVSYKVRDSSSRFSYETVTTDDVTDKDEEEVTIRGLNVGTEYVVTVKAFNSAGTGPSSEEVTCATLRGDPPSAPNVRLVGVDTDSLTLDWKTPHEEGRVLQYVLEFKKDGMIKHQRHLPGSISSYKVTHLQTGSRYELRLAAYNKFGRGSASSPVVAFTEALGVKLAEETEDGPFYIRLYFIIPVAVSLTVIVCAVVVAWACLKKEHIVEKNQPIYVAYGYRSSYEPPPTMQGTLKSRDSRALESGYDVPWDVTGYIGSGKFLTRNKQVKEAKKDRGKLRLDVRSTVTVTLNTGIFLQQRLWPHGKVDRPILQPFEFPRDIELGSRVQIICNLKKGDLPVVLVWKKNGEPLSLGGEINIAKLNDFSNVLMISNIDSEDVANYTCTATNSAGSDSFTADLIVRAPPFWKQQSENTVQAIFGTRTLIACSVGGYPAPRITWKIKGPSGSLTPISRSYKMKVLDNGTLLINDVKETDSGTYLCQAENGVGESLEKAVRLSVHVPPSIESYNEVVTVQRGYTKSVRCIARGERPLLVRWLRNNHLLEPWSNRHETYSKETTVGTNSTLVIRNVQTQDAALYTCYVENSYGNDSWNIKMIVNEPPQSPSNIVVEDVRSRIAKVSWRSSTTRSAVTQFIVRFWESSRYFGVKKLKEQVLSFGETSLLLRDLHPGTKYTVEIQAENSIGLSEPSDPVKFTTQEEEPIASPVDVNVFALDSGTLLVSWKSPPRHQWNGVLKGYYVSYKVKDSSSRFSYETVTTDDVTDKDEEEVTIRGLNVGTEYVVTVKAFNSAGTGPSSEEVTCATLRGDPPSPPKVRLVGVDTDSLTLDWKTPHEEGPVLQYVLEFKKDGMIKHQRHLPGSISSYKVTHLQTGSRYELRLAAYNKFGRGSASSPVVAFTEALGVTLAEETEDGPFYIRLYFIIPVAVSLTVIVCAVVVAWACLKKEHIVEKNQPIYVAYGYRSSYEPPPTMQGTLKSRDSRALESGYDIPWDVTGYIGSGSSDGNYTKLKQVNPNT
ncbi:cell adhesion molecule DSCAML1-like [Tachypleus tridentatus]|uniref:cell adhesion molecule DSCAML1-like n=1 Tax=Tachypleus tridentatus TaxID=6853 RepID=UPI003FD4C1DC